ncbi:phage holin family protein [Beijerinckia indica]|uniref:Holin-X, holin superfamily III n=1 Tax=Beijerinckia indica subsp. indica (strain ATCC 9039 / DSM 1715 / NCIMB 8712) TaxID=395963 RepID=B2ID33_BEII9|nr:phage holin family protein [Beijerinckia indica]ACB96798.1 hypothetical protein Bind_3238 [Beijerinckia indica subsp. indica ATCC 9039]
MTPFLQRLAHDAAAPLVDFGVTLAKKVALLLFAALFLLSALIFLTIALFGWLATMLEQPLAALTIGAIYLLAAVLTLVLALRKPAPVAPVSLQERLAAAQAEQDKAEKSEAERAQQTKTATQIDEIVTPLLGFLQDAGLEREKLAVLAGASVAKQLHGYSLVLAGMIAGFFAGRFYFTKGRKLG